MTFEAKVVLFQLSFFMVIFLMLGQYKCIIVDFIMQIKPSGAKTVLKLKKFLPEAVLLSVGVLIKVSTWTEGGL